MPIDPTATISDPGLDDEPYDSGEDEDFTLDPAAQDDDFGISSSSEGSDNEDGQPAAKKRKTGKSKSRKELDEPAELDSGDEAMIRKAKDRKKKHKQKKQKATGDDEDEDDEEDLDFDEDEEGAGEGGGGFVRTRAMKMRIQEERKPLARIDGATIDVDALWAKMNATEPDRGSTPSQVATQEDEKDVEMRGREALASQTQDLEKPPAQFSEEMIKIKRTYKFAGEMITEEKLVAKDSAEAKLYLANASGKDGEIEIITADGASTVDAETSPALRRPLRRVSRFDPNPTGFIKKSWEKQALAVEAGGQQDENARGPKINTVEKSRLDWAAYVDQAGIKDELRVHSKAKEGFLGRMDFLDRVDAKREEERRNARLKGR